MKYSGVLEKSDLEGGVFVFKTDSGQQFYLEGLSASLLRDGAKLEIDGEVDKGMATIGMMGDTLKVRSAKAL